MHGHVAFGLKGHDPLIRSQHFYERVRNLSEPWATSIAALHESAYGRFCCRSPLQAFLVSDSVAVMRFATGVARDQAESGDVKTSADDLAALLHRLSDVSTHEIEKLIDELQALRKQLENAGNRIQRDIAEYAELSQQIMQLTAIISDSVKKLPRGTHL